MSRYTVICHRCGKSTFVDLSKTVSDQRCRACRGFLHGVDVTIGEKPEIHRKLVTKIAGAAGAEPVWRDQEMPVIPIRQRWPRYYKWIIWTGLATFLTAIMWIGYVRFRDSAKGFRPLVEQEATTPPDVRETPEWCKRATVLAKSALAAKTVDELLPMLYHPEVSDEVIRRYYLSEEQLPLGSELDERYFIPPGNYKENVVAFSFSDGARRARWIVVVEKPGGMMVDWPSLVGLGEMSVKDYVQTAPEQVVVMRVRARVGSYYNDYFADSSKWLSVRLSDVTNDNVVHGYYDRAMPGAIHIEQTLTPPESNREWAEPAIVVLKHPAGNVSSDQTQIVGFFSTTWYQQEGLKPLIEQARKMDAARTGKPVEENKEETPAPAPEAPPPPAPGP